MITTEIKDANQIAEGRAELEIYCDSAGLRELQKQLNFLLAGETHVHLATAAWAGNELGEAPFGKENVLLHQVTIVRVPD